MIFFHVGPGGNMNGIGAAMRQLDTANIPVALKSADNYGPIGELVGIMRASGHAHYPVYRVSTQGKNDGNSYDVPPYHLSPSQAAAEHWRLTKAALPPEFDKERVWVEVINEVDKNKADWLGNFAAEISILSIADGFKVVLFGWSAGEPEPSHWLEPGMVRFLEMAAANPGRIAISLHEYSYEPNELDVIYPYRIGRFQALHAACDSLGIDHPTLFITEFGWTLNHVPEPDVAMPQLEWAFNLYRPYANIKGVAIWYLGASYEGIAQEAQRLIQPVADMLVRLWDGSAPPPEPDCEGVAREPYNREYWVIPQSATIARATEIFRAGYAQRRTVGFSYDDAGIGAGLGSRTAVLWDIPPVEYIDYTEFYREYYPGVIVEFRPEIAPPVPQGNARIGLHAGADSGDISEAEFSEFLATRPEVIKVLSSHSGPSIGRLASQHPGVPFVVRAYLDFGGRHITPQQFVNDTLSDVRRAVEAIGGQHDIWLEIHNEPNLYAEGLGSSWSSGATFNSWYLSALASFKRELPTVKFLFPGLSPGPAVVGVRVSAQTFIGQCGPAVFASDGLAIHAYWNTLPSTPYPMSTALMEVDWYVDQYPGVKLWVTEASNNKAGNPADKGQEYITFWRELRQRHQVGGVTYFVASGSNPDFAEEVWVGRGIGAVVGGRQEQ